MAAWPLRLLTCTEANADFFSSVARLGEVVDQNRLEGQVEQPPLPLGPRILEVLPTGARPRESAISQAMSRYRLRTDRLTDHQWLKKIFGGRLRRPCLKPKTNSQG
jgi:hypothetical protein